MMNWETTEISQAGDNRGLDRSANSGSGEMVGF